MLIMHHVLILIESDIELKIQPSKWERKIVARTLWNLTCLTRFQSKVEQSNTTFLWARRCISQSGPRILWMWLSVKLNVTYLETKRLSCNVVKWASTSCVVCHLLTQDIWAQCLCMPRGKWAVENKHKHCDKSCKKVSTSRISTIRHLQV